MRKGQAVLLPSSMFCSGSDSSWIVRVSWISFVTTLRGILYTPATWATFDWQILIESTKAAAAFWEGL